MGFKRPLVRIQSLGPNNGKYLLILPIIFCDWIRKLEMQKPSGFCCPAGAHLSKCAALCTESSHSAPQPGGGFENLKCREAAHHTNRTAICTESSHSAPQSGGGFENLKYSAAALRSLGPCVVRCRYISVRGQGYTLKWRDPGPRP